MFLRFNSISSETEICSNQFFSEWAKINFDQNTISNNNYAIIYSALLSFICGSNSTN